MSARTVGLTASGDFQVGVRRTFPISVQDAWKLVTSSEGMVIWLGSSPPAELEVGSQLHTEEGITGEIRVMNEQENIRLKWKKDEWSHPSILQIRTISKGENRTTISFHQEKLPDAGAREEMQNRWEHVLGKLEEYIHAR